MTHLGTTLLAMAMVTTAACSTSSTRPPEDAETDAAPDAATDAAPDSAPADAAPDTSPPGCVPTETYYEPGCGEGTAGYTTIEPGCYQPCAGPEDASCAADLVCARTVINPCICIEGEVCCGACGSDEWLCLPPPPADCSGRSYCECDAGCEPLVDLSTGCICTCDDPFNCSGLMCDCDCGGATYLGCAPVGQCPEISVDCGDCEAVVIDGCPSCVCTG